VVPGVAGHGSVPEALGKQTYGALAISELDFVEWPIQSVFVQCSAGPFPVMG